MLIHIRYIQIHTYSTLSCISVLYCSIIQYYQCTTVNVHVYVCVCMCMFVHVCISQHWDSKGIFSPQSAEYCLPQIEYQKHIDFSTKMPLTISGLERPPAGAYVTVCPTEPLGLYIHNESNVLYFTIRSYRSYIQIYTDTCNTYTYIHIHTHTYTRPYVSEGIFELVRRPHATRQPEFPTQII
jgi:hypothetical protein